MSFDLVVALATTVTKKELQDIVAKFIDDHDFTATEVNFDKPWGGYFRIDESDAESFVNAFFPGQTYDQVSRGLTLTPKILVVLPGSRLSWQYHFRREEVWRTIIGPVGYVTSDDDEPGELQTLPVGGIVAFGAETRHRLIGLDSYGIVAEFWKHTDPVNPSVEADIVRVQDDFSRD